MTHFEGLVLRGIGILIRLQMSPGREPGSTLEQHLAKVDAEWKDDKYPAILAWEDEAANALAQREDLQK